MFNVQLLPSGRVVCVPISVFSIVEWFVFLSITWCHCFLYFDLLASIFDEDSVTFPSPRVTILAIVVPNPKHSDLILAV